MIMNRRITLALFWILSCLVAAPAATAQTVEGIAAVVNDEPITTYDVRNRMRLIISSAGIEPTEEMLERIQEQAMRGLVEESLQLQEARQYEIEVDDAEVNASLSDQAARNGTTLEQIESELAASGISIDTLRRQVRAEIAWQIMVSGRYRSRVRVSDYQIETALARQAEAAAKPQYQLAEILVEVSLSEGGEDAAVQRIQGLYQMMGQGIAFPNIAEQFSDAPSASNGGFLGWVNESSLVPQVAEVLAQMSEGSVTNPIRVPGGFQILALISKREGQVVEQLDLTQITIPTSRVNDDNRAALSRAAQAFNGCEGGTGAFDEIEGAIVTPLGSLNANALIPQIREAISGVEPGQATTPIESPVGLQTFLLCDRTLTGPGMPTFDQVENQLINAQLSMLARRWLRDLRRDATVEIR